MSQRPSILSPPSSFRAPAARGFHFEDDDSTSSLQALIDILRRPQQSECAPCIGRGAYVTGGRCEHCGGTGKRPHQLP